MEYLPYQSIPPNPQRQQTSIWADTLGRIWSQVLGRAPVQITGNSVQPSSVPSGSSLIPSVSPGVNGILNVAALTQNITIGTPAGTAVDGQTLKLRLRQNATGGWAITWGAGYLFGTDTTEDLIPTEASAVWTMLFEYWSSDGLWHAEGIQRGF